jgi:purine-binding chemotaxis protein CheW
MTTAIDITNNGLSTNEQYLVFSLGGEEFAIDILKVQEIRTYEQPTRIPNSPPTIKGVTNLRGVIVPIIDLRIKLNLENVQYVTETVVIVANVGHRIVGIVVDGVSDVMTLTEEHMKPVPDFTLTMSSDYISGLASIEDRMLIIVNIDKFLNTAELAAL